MISRNFKVRENGFPEFNCQMALIGNFHRIFDSPVKCFFIKPVKFLSQFFRSFNIVFSKRSKTHSVFIIFQSVCLQTNQNIMKISVIFLGVMAVICDNHLDVEFLRYFYQNRIYYFLAVNPMVLQFNIIIFAE